MRNDCIAVRICLVNLVIQMFSDTSSPSHVIKWLFHGNPLFRAAAVSFESGVTLVSATGHEVTINVSPAGSDEYRLSLRGSNVILLTAVHLAILTKVKVIIL